MTRLSIIDKMQATPTGSKRPDDFSTPSFSMECAATGITNDNSLDANEEWRLEGKLTINFWANRAQYLTARKRAERVLVYSLYGEVLNVLPNLRLAISNGNRVEAMVVCDQIEDLIRGE